MRFGRILSPGPEARLLPAEKLHGPTVAVLAIMTFAMVVVAGAGLALAGAASMVARGAEHRFVIQLPAASAPELDRVVAAARSVDGVRAVEPVTEKDMRATLERWLGEAANSADLPVPAMATVDAPNANETAIAAAIEAAAPDATVTGENVELEPLLRSIRALQWLALALVALMAAATAAAIVLAARGALDTHRSTVEIMHRIGATDRQVVRLFERKIAIDAIAGALGGAMLAAIVLLVVVGGVAAVSTGFAATVPLGTADVFILALIPLAAVALVIAIAHWTLLRALRETL